MNSKYGRLSGRKGPPSAEARCLEPEVQDKHDLQGMRWDEQTYVAARELRAAASLGQGWMPFSAPGLSVGPSLLRNHVRVDLLDQHGTPRSLLVTSADLAHWLAGIH